MTVGLQNKLKNGNIIFFSKNAIYNTVNNDTKFYNDVELLRYLDHKITK